MLFSCCLVAFLAFIVDSEGGWKVAPGGGSEAVRSSGPALSPGSVRVSSLAGGGRGLTVRGSPPVVLIRADDRAAGGRPQVAPRGSELKLSVLPIAAGPQVQKVEQIVQDKDSKCVEDRSSGRAAVAESWRGGVKPVVAAGGQQVVGVQQQVKDWRNKEPDMTGQEVGPDVQPGSREAVGGKAAAGDIAVEVWGPSAGQPEQGKRKSSEVALESWSNQQISPVGGGWKGVEPEAQPAGQAEAWRQKPQAAWKTKVGDPLGSSGQLAAATNVDPAFQQRENWKPRVAEMDPGVGGLDQQQAAISVVKQAASEPSLQQSFKGQPVVRSEAALYSKPCGQLQHGSGMFPYPSYPILSEVEPAQWGLVGAGERLGGWVPAVPQSWDDLGRPPAGFVEPMPKEVAGGGFNTGLWSRPLSGQSMNETQQPLLAAPQMRPQPLLTGRDPNSILSEIMRDAGELLELNGLGRREESQPAPVAFALPNFVH